MLATAKRLSPTQVFRKLGSMKQALEKIDSDLRLNHYRIREFKPNVEFSFERGDYLVKTASNGDELAECLRLRFDVFHKEYMNKSRTYGVDIDSLDFLCDHLLIHDKRAGRTIGTYRINSSLFTNTFYSAGEFDLGKILEMSGNKLELGRACIEKSYRTGAVIALLWRGIAEYINRTETRVLFGCGSIKTMEPMEIGLITKYLQDTGAITYEYGVSPTRKYKVRQLSQILSYIDANPIEYHRESVQKSIPSLFTSYLRAGAKLCGEPALDREFRCIDFLTCLRIDELDRTMKDKYKL